MNIRSQRLARGLSGLLTVLLLLCALGLIVLIPATIFAYLAPESIPGGLTLRANGQVVDPRVPLIAGTMLLYAIAALAVATVIVMKLRQVIGTVAAGSPFDPRNVTRLRMIGGAMGALVVFEAIGGLVTPAPIRAALNLRDGGFDLGTFLAMLVVLVLAEVFREGTRLRDDAEMTV